MVVRIWWKGNCFALLVGMQTSAATVGRNMEIPQKIKNGTAFWPRNPTSGTISEGTQNTNSKEHKQPCVYLSIIYNHQDMEAAQVSINRWVDKTTMAHLHNRILLSHKKKNILPFVTLLVDLENSMLSGISQSEKDNTIWFHFHVESKQTK